MVAACITRPEVEMKPCGVVLYNPPVKFSFSDSIPDGTAKSSTRPVGGDQESVGLCRLRPWSGGRCGLPVARIRKCVRTALNPEAQLQENKFNMYRTYEIPTNKFSREGYDSKECVQGYVDRFLRLDDGDGFFEVGISTVIRKFNANADEFQTLTLV